MPTTMEKVLILKTISIFSRVPADLLVPLARLAEPVVVAAGDEIVRQGELGDSLYAIIRGRVKVVADGREVAVLGPRDCFGEMAILDHEPRSATVAALEETELFEIAQEDFYEILHERSEIAEEVIRMLTGRLRAELKKSTGAHG
jgi:CRP-like cAMP-binding protein